MIKLPQAIGRLGLLLIFSILSASCSYPQKSENINIFVDYSDLEDVNQEGKYIVHLQKNSTMSGKAEFLGDLCRAHSFPYDFSDKFDEVITTISEKAYEKVLIKQTETSPLSNKETGQVLIRINPIDIKLMCFLTSSFTGDCRAITRLSAHVEIINLQNKESEFNIEVEGNKTNSAGGFCDGGAIALSSSIGSALNDFGRKLHQSLTAN